MKTPLIFSAATLILCAGCQSSDLSSTADVDQRYPHGEPYSKEQSETIDERAGAQTQSREGIEENPFLEPSEDIDRRRQRVVTP